MTDYARLVTAKERYVGSMMGLAVADALDNLCYGTVVMSALAHRQRDLPKQADTILEMFMKGFGDQRAYPS